MTSIGMSIEYVEVYNQFKDSDLICSIGFGFNADDENINGVIRTLVDDGKHLLVIEPTNNTKTASQRARKIGNRLKVASFDNIDVMWTDALINLK